MKNKKLYEVGISWDTLDGDISIMYNIIASNMEEVIDYLTNAHNSNRFEFTSGQIKFIEEVNDNEIIIIGD